MKRVVWHLVDGSSSGEELWGKERVIADVLDAQRGRADLEPRLICFNVGALARRCAARGLPVAHLDGCPRRLPTRALPRLLAILRETPGAILHTHGYKANVVGRLARVAGAPVSRLVATCHGWPDETAATRRYNALDRWSAFLSDATTVPDATMVLRFPRYVRDRVRCVPNAVPDRDAAPPEERAAARARFGWNGDAFVVAIVGRLTEEKGCLDVLDAVHATGPSTIWAFAGTGPLAARIRAAGDRARILGYLSPADTLLDAADVFLQASHSEGLSLALLEAMRARLAIVATDVGGTRSAVRHEREALIVDARDPAAIVRSITRLRDDSALRGDLAHAARQRFEMRFRTDRQAEDFARAYDSLR